MSSASDRPLRRDAERNRQRILAAARAVFADHGLDATLDDIAHHAGVGVGTVYRRFPNKEELIDALFEERVGEVVACAERGLAHADPWQGLVGFLEAGTELMAQDRGLKELLLGGHGHGRDRVAAGRARIAPLVAALCARARDAGALRADVEHTDLALVQIMLGAVTEATAAVAPDAWRRMLGLALDGLRPGRSEPTPLSPAPLALDQMDDVMRALNPRSSRGPRRPPTGR